MLELFFTVHRHCCSGWAHRLAELESSLWSQALHTHQGIHRKIRLIEVNAKMRHLKKLTCKGTLRQVFIRVYRLEMANFLRTFRHVGIFNQALWFVLTPPLLSGSTLPPPHLPSVNEYTVLCARIQYVMGAGMGFWANPPAKSLYRSIFEDDDILHCLLWVLSF
jgi:hypothetical protein